MLGVFTAVPEICPPIDLPNKDFFVPTAELVGDSKTQVIADSKQALIDDKNYTALADFDKAVVPRAVLEHRGVTMAAH